MMKKMNEMILKGFVRLQCQKGQTTTEYMLVIGTIVVAVIGAGVLFQKEIGTLVTAVGEKIRGGK